MRRAKDGNTALISASFSGNEKGVRRLVAAGANLNATDDEGETALSIARDRKVGRKKAHDRIYAFLVGASRQRFNINC